MKQVRIDSASVLKDITAITISFVRGEFKIYRNFSNLKRTKFCDSHDVHTFFVIRFDSSFYWFGRCKFDGTVDMRFRNFMVSQGDQPF